MSMKTLAAAGLLFVAAPAWAGESLVGGQALQYNHPYPCKGERIIVAHCRDEDDSSYCQTVYPDRPFVNGNQVAPVEMRGDIVAKLNACSQVASAPSAAAPAPKGPIAHANTGHPPGVGNGNWYLMDFDAKSATYFTKSRIKRSGANSDGWFTVVYAKPKDIVGTSLKNAQFFQMHYLANCSKGTERLTEGAYLDEDGKVMSSSLITEAESPFAKPKEKTLSAEQFDVLCGKGDNPLAKTPLEGDGSVLVFDYTMMLHENGLIPPE